MALARFLTSDDPALRAIRDLYEGRGLTVADLPRMSGRAIAAAFDVHPHSLDVWIQRWGWHRPSWYKVGRPFQVKPSERSQAALRLELLGLVRAAAGQPCPSNVKLAAAARISTGTLVVQLRNAIAAGELSSESRGPYRLLTLRDGTATGWTAKINGRETALMLGIASGSEARSPVGRLILVEVRRAAEGGERCPTNAALAKLARCTKGTARRALARNASAGNFRIEYLRAAGKRQDRRILFESGIATAWESGAGLPGTDYAVLDAERALRRQGLVVFDVAVHTGRGWGIAWSIDGKVVGRAELIEVAADRQAKAMEALQASP